MEKEVIITCAGIAIVANNTGRVLMLQRALEDGDPASGKWEFPGGKLENSEDPLEAAKREWKEETGSLIPKGKFDGSWVSDNGIYKLFIYRIENESDLDINMDHEDRRVLNPDDPDGDQIEVVAWWKIEDLFSNPALREEARATDWGLLNKELKKENKRPMSPLSFSSFAFSTEQILALVNLTLIEDDNIHYHFDPETQFYNQCHSEADGKFCSGPDSGVSGRTILRDSDGSPTKKEVPQKRGKLGASLVDPHENTREVDGIRGYDKKSGKPVPGTDAYLEAHNITPDIFERRPYIKYEASKEDEALNTAFPKDDFTEGKNYSKPHRLFVGTAEDTDPKQTGGYIMYKHEVPDSPHGEIFPQIRPNAPVVTDKGKRAKAKTVLDNANKRLDVLEKTTPEQFIKERRAEVRRAKIDLTRAEKATPEMVKAEATKSYDAAKEKYKRVKANTDDPDTLDLARKELGSEKRVYEKTIKNANKENFKDALLETKTLQVRSAENQLKNAITNPEGSLNRAISRQRGLIKRDENAYEKTAAKYLFTPGVTSARIDMNQDPQNVKNLVNGKGRIYLAMEGSIKNDAILTSIRKEDPTATVVNVPSVTLWQQKNLAPEIPTETAWFADKYAGGRDVILIPDADGVKNNAVMSQAKALKSALLQNGAGQVYLATPPLKAGTKQIDKFLLPSGKGEERKGIDDHLGAGRGTLGQLQYRTFTEYPNYDLKSYTLEGGAKGVEKMNAGARPNAEHILAAISGLVEDKGIATIPLKTLNQTAGFRKSQKTSSRDAMNTLERLGIIKIEWVYDRKALGRYERVLNPEMSEHRKDELVSQGVIKEPHIYKKHVEVSFDEAPVISILKPEYIIRADRVHTGALSELPDWKPPKTFNGWTSSVDGRPDSTGIAAKQVTAHEKFIKKNTEARAKAATPTVTKGKTTKERLAEKTAPSGRRLVRTEEGAKRYGVAVGQPIPLSAIVTHMVLLSSVLTEEELIEFYNQCHGEDGKFCEGVDGPGRTRDNTVSGKFLGQHGNIHTVADAGLVGTVEVDGIKARAVYETYTKNGDAIRLYDKSGNVGGYKDELLETQAKMHELYPLDPPRNIVVTEPDGLFRNSEVQKDTFAIVYGNEPNTYINSDMLGVDLKNYSDGFQMPSAKTGNTKDMSYLVEHEYGHHLDFAKHSNKGFSYDEHPMYDNPAFHNHLSRYGSSDSRGIEGYAETFAEWNHSEGKTQNPAAIAMARYEGWPGANSLRSSGEIISLVSQALISLAESIKAGTDKSFEDINSDMPSPIGKGIIAIDSLTEDGPKVVGSFKTVKPTIAEIARADGILRQVYIELGLDYPEDLVEHVADELGSKDQGAY